MRYENAWKCNWYLLWFVCLSNWFKNIFMEHVSSTLWEDQKTNVPKHPTSVSESCQDFNLSNLHFREFLGINFGHFEAGLRILGPSNGREGNLFSSAPGFLGWYDWPQWSNHELLGYKCLEGSRKHTTGGPLPTSPRLHASSKLLHHLGVCWRWSRLRSVLRPQQVGRHNSNTKPGMKDLHATSSTCQELQGKYFEVSSACWVSLPASKGSNLETSCFSCFSSASFPDI